MTVTVTLGYMNRSFCTVSFELVNQHAPLVMQPHLGGDMGHSRALGGRFDLYGNLCGRAGGSPGGRACSLKAFHNHPRHGDEIRVFQVH